MLVAGIAASIWIQVLKLLVDTCKVPEHSLLSALTDTLEVAIFSEKVTSISVRAEMLIDSSIGEMAVTDNGVMVFALVSSLSSVVHDEINTKQKTAHVNATIDRLNIMPPPAW